MNDSEALVKCAYCGTEGPHRYHSGVPECQACWNWRKLNSGATRYWRILSLMLESSVDMYDLSQYFPKILELSEDEIKTFLTVIRKMNDKTKALAQEHHVEERWHEQAQELFDQLRNGIRPKEKNDGRELYDQAYARRSEHREEGDAGATHCTNADSDS